MSSSLQEFRYKWLNEIAEKRRGQNVDDLTFHKRNGEKSDSVRDLSASESTSDRFSWRNAEIHEVANDNVSGHYIADEQKSDYIPFVIVDNLLNDGIHDSNRNICSFSNKRKFRDISKSNIFDKCPPNKGYCDEVKCTKTSRLQPEEDLVMKLVSDIDEVTDIPFFDIDLPRELAMKIFQYLDASDLCHCCQVSRSWHHLARDNFLWRGIARRLGFNCTGNDSDRDDWKKFVGQRIHREQKLITNWKGRLGEVQQIEFVQGGALRAVDVLLSSDRIVAGYSSGQVRLHDLSNNDACIFTPSSVALDIDESSDHGTLSNDVLLVKTCPKYTVAAYKHGNIDVWQNDGGTDVIHSYTCPTPPSSIELSQRTAATFIVAACGQHLITLAKHDEGQWKTLEYITLTSKIIGTQILERCDHDCMVVLATSNTVRLHMPGNDVDHMTTLHDIIHAPVTSIDACSKKGQLAVGVNTCMSNGYKVKVYEMEKGRLLHDLAGHTWIVSCMNLRDSPENCLVTGCGDRRVRLYDLRSGQSPVTTLVGHGQSVSHVQMDDWKVVSADSGGLVCVWDRRMARRLWDWHNRHPVAYCSFLDRRLYVANIPDKVHITDDVSDGILPSRHRGSIYTYDFLSDRSTRGLPDVCFSSYDSPDAYNYNIRLTMPYDVI